MVINEEHKKMLKVIGGNFKLIREKRDLTLDKLSELSGIEIKILTDIENGEDFDLDYVFKLCQIYNIEPKAIFQELD